MSQNWPTMWGIVDIDADSHHVLIEVESHDGITTIRPQIAPASWAISAWRSPPTIYRQRYRSRR